jgi:uncharacterized membrane protein YdjX (TVP38/TMEM64 family)
MMTTIPRAGRLLILLAAGSMLLAPALLVALTGFDGTVRCLETLCDRGLVHRLVATSGWAAALVFIGLQTLQVLVPPIPGDAVVFLGGYTFGAPGGIALSTAGMLVGSVLNFFIGLLLGKRTLQRFIGCETYDRLDGMVRHKGLLAIFLLFLIPGFPKDYLCIALGMTTIPLSVFLLVSTAGRLPWTIAVSLQGAAVFERQYMVFALAAAVCVLLSIGFYLRRDAMARWMAARGNAGSCAGDADSGRPEDDETGPPARDGVNALDTRRR